jgi:hypothetical protein
MFAEQFAGAIERADFTETNHLANTLWKAYNSGHLTDDEAQVWRDNLDEKPAAI